MTLHSTYSSLAVTYSSRVIAKDKEFRELERLHSQLLATGIFLLFATALFLHTVIEPTVLDRLIETASAAELPLTDKEICADLGRYTNGADYQAYCDSI